MLLPPLSFGVALRRLQAPTIRGCYRPLHQLSASRPACRRSSVMSQGNGTTGVATSSQDERVTFLPDGTLAKRTKLGVVVKDAVRRWYLEAEKEAYRGDVKSQALLGQMLIEGYGCTADPERGREWVEKARRRGYKMQGVYCVI